MQIVSAHFRSLYDITPLYIWDNLALPWKLAYSIKFYKLIALIVCIVCVLKKNCDLYYEFLNINNDRVSGKVPQSVESVSEPVCFYFSFYLRA